MNDFDLPIFKKSYNLYKTFYGFRHLIAQQDRYAIWQKCDNLLLDTLESVMLASQISGNDKISTLEKTSAKLNLLRIFMRLMKDTRVIDIKKYALLEQPIDEIGRMLGGWLRYEKEERERERERVIRTSPATRGMFFLTLGETSERTPTPSHSDHWHCRTCWH